MSNVGTTGSANDARVHVWHRCHGCGAEPIVGRRYDCRTCPAGPDNHLCERCHAAYRDGTLAHPAPESLAAVARAVTGPHQFVDCEGVPADRFDAWAAPPDVDCASPHVPDRRVLRPEFMTASGSSLGSYAFAIAADAGQPPLVITALHVLDEVIKSARIDCTAENTSYTGRELPAIVRSVNLYDPFAANWMRAHLGEARPMLAIPGARIDDEEPYCQRDVAAFVAPGDGLNPARLADAPPSPGDPVWLAVNDRAHGRRTIRAVVVERSPRAMIFRYARGTELPKYSSGAPIVDRRGGVVGINVGAGALGGCRYGHAVHVDSIRAHLASVLSRT